MGDGAGVGERSPPAGSGGPNGRADEIADDHDAAADLADAPLVVGSLEVLGELAQVLAGVAAQAGEDAVDVEDGGDNGDEEGPEETPPAYGTSRSGSAEGEERDAGDGGEGGRLAAGALKDADAFAAMEGVSEHGAGGGGIEVVEGGKDGTEAAQVSGDAAGIDRLGEGGEAGERGNAGAELFAGVEVGERDVQGPAGGNFRVKSEPGTSAAGAEVDDAIGAGLADGVAEEGGDGGVGAVGVPDGFERLGDAVAQGRGEPGLIVNFKPGLTLHGFP